MLNEFIFWSALMTCFFVVLISIDFFGGNDDRVTKGYISGRLILFFWAMFFAVEYLFLINATTGN